jgi:hypothetical protein
LRTAEFSSRLPYPKNHLSKYSLDEARIPFATTNGASAHSVAHKPYQATGHSHDLIENTSNPASDSEQRPDRVLQSRNPYSLTSTAAAAAMAPGSQSRSPGLSTSLSPFGKSNGHHHQSTDHGKSGSSLLTGTSFDVLMNNLKSMRDKDLDLLIRDNDDNLIHLTD